MTNSLFITGASGFVGGALARLALARGRVVHAFVRPTSPRGGLEGASIHEGDILEPASLDRAMARIDGPFDVVHSAALISYRTRDADLARRVNVEGTRHVLEAAKRRGARRVCHVSSVVAVGVALGAETLDEESDFRGVHGSHYTTTKRAAEDYVRAIAREQEVVIVNPGAIFGPSATPTNSTRFLERARDGRLPAFAPPGTLSLVAVEDVAAGILSALERGRPGARYLLTGEVWTHRRLFDEVARLAGHRGPRATLPGWLWSLAGLGVLLVDRARPQELVTPQMMAHLGARYRFRANRARRELGWEAESARSLLARAFEALD
ncbi:MAG: NAD-dependent epimerase/dehydratase family protein [Planctomycetota bacterium]